ncbi:MAG: hypothetical protein FJ265_09855 [Planctomycetes bacterium]|nr:hypothetical protein [Planctomycetota bacterium]
MHRAARFAVPLLLPLTVLAQAPAAAAAKPPTASPFVQDFETARSHARNRQLTLLMVFQGPAADGSDVRLEQEVLARPEFATAAAKTCVLARFDYPQDASQVPEVLKRQNAWLLTKYPSRRLPMLWLADGAGRAFAKTGWLPGGHKGLLEWIAAKQAAHESAVAALQRAATCGGIERVKALAEGLRNLDDDIVATVHFREVLEIVGTDRDGSLGCKAEFDAIARDAAAKPSFERVRDELQALVEQQKWPELGARIEALRKEHPDARWARQYLDYAEGVRRADGEADPAAALLLFEQALASAPRSETAPWIALRRQQAAAAVLKLEEERRRQEAEAAKKQKGGKAPAPPKKK